MTHLQAAIAACLVMDWDAHECLVSALREERRRRRISAGVSAYHRRRRRTWETLCLAEDRERERRIEHEWAMAREERG